MAQVQTVEEIVTRQLSVPSQNTVLFGAFALLALLLASIGLYGVLSYAVTQRTNEIGVPVALGARSRDILIFFSRRGLTLTLGGLAIGVLLSVMAPRAMRTLFYDFQPDYLSAVWWPAPLSSLSPSWRVWFPRAARRASIRWPPCGRK